MYHLELTRPTPAENLALDEALLDEFALESRGQETLRLWEPAGTAVIVGRASRLTDEVDRTYCAAHGVPVVRRCSGGAAIVTGPGCLMYAVTLSTVDRPELQVIDHAHHFVLSRMAAALRGLGLDVCLAGTSDLTLNNRKFSGNSLRCKREALLYHGTLLYAGDLDQISRCLVMPPRQPDYRQQRSHRDFLTNLPVDGRQLRNALVSVWSDQGPRAAWPQARTEQLVAERYALAAWNEAR